MNKKITAAFSAVCIAASAFSQLYVYAAGSIAYTFSGTNIVTTGEPTDYTDVKLTDDISLTTSGDINRKYAAVTTLENNKNVGTYPIYDAFKAEGSYIYLACTNVNNNSIFALNMPEIPAGSKVTLTYAKPTVTNNGSTIRNANDPYAYLKIADRYISVNGDEFDTWLTKSVVTGEDTSAIEFHCDMWGAIAVSKIEITDGDGKPLHSLTINSARYANVTVNGIRLCADGSGALTVSSLQEGETVTAYAEKDGYFKNETSVTVGSSDLTVDLPLECETDDVYYESDFGNTAGTLVFDDDIASHDPFELGGIVSRPITKIRGRLTFNGKGDLRFISDVHAFLGIRYTDEGIYVNDSFVTSKDNMEFEAVIDKNSGEMYFAQNGDVIECNIASELNTIDRIIGTDVTLEYIGITYPDNAAAVIDGPDKVSSAFCNVSGNGILYAVTEYDVSYDFWGDDIKPEISVSGIDGAFISYFYSRFSGKSRPVLYVPLGAEGTAVICADFNGHKTYKNVEVYNNPAPGRIEYISRPINLYSTAAFGMSGYDDCGVSELYDEYGNKVYSIDGQTLNADFTLTDYRSSDESVISIDDNGIMTAKNAGSAVISAEVAPGGYRISAEYTVKGLYIDGMTEDDISYAINSITSDENISSYLVTYSDGVTEDASPTEIPAAQAVSDGAVITAVYDADGKLSCVQKRDVKAGDKLLPSNGNKTVYLRTTEGFEEITHADTTVSGFELKHSAGAEYEISPVYTFTDIGDAAEEKALNADFPDGYYDIAFKKAEAKRGDIYVNGTMVGNNVDQADADRTLTDGALYTAEDIKITGGKIAVSMTDGSTKLDYVTVTKKPVFYKRPRRVYIIGDSLACAYYGGFEQDVGGGRSGWGQQLPDFLNAPVTNLANSGQFAAGLYTTAFPGVTANAQAGDILLIECAYNDRAYSTRDEMDTCVKSMIEQCNDNGITPILVTPNASAHDYKPSVVWSGYMRDIAVDTGCQLIDLSQKSYDLLYSIYGDDADGNITKNFNLTEVGGDTLHSSYAGAYVWASVVAQGLKDLGYGDILNTGFTYSFTDTLGNEITAQVN